MIKKIICLLLFSFSISAAPVLNFSDIDSGPKTGNGDGVGSGVIVTIWGNNLGSSQGSSKVYVGAVEATAIYYWKNADGTLPGGPTFNCRNGVDIGAYSYDDNSCSATEDCPLPADYVSQSKSMIIRRR